MSMAPIFGFASRQTPVHKILCTPRRRLKAKALRNASGANGIDSRTRFDRGYQTRRPLIGV